MNRADDIKVLDEARPFIRSIAAFLVYLRFGIDRDRAYAEADVFIDQLRKDLK